MMKLVEYATSALLCGSMLSMMILVGCEESPEAKQAKIKDASDRSSIIAEIGDCQIWEVFSPHGPNPYLALCADKKVPVGMSYTKPGTTKPATPSRTVQTIVPE